MTRIRKKIYISIHIFNKEANHYYSVQQEVETGMETAQPHLHWNREVIRAKNTGKCVGGSWWAGGEWASLPTSSYYANRNKDTLRCQLQKN